MLRFFTVLLVSMVSPSAVLAQLHVIPVEYYNKGILIRMVAGTGKDSLNFIFDTGATQTVIDSATAEKAGIIANQMAMVAGVTGMQKIPMTDSLALQTSDLKLPTHSAILVNLSQLSSRYGKEIHGIIGYELLHRFIVRLDLDKRQIELYRSVADIPSSSLGERLIFSFSNAIPIPQAECTIRLKSGRSIKARFLLDSGALGVTAVFNAGFSKQIS